MKIGFSGLNIPEGKIKYNDEIINKLAEKFQPKKVVYYFFEFIKDEFHKCDSIVIAKDKILDLLVEDMEKLENRLERTNDNTEENLIKRCLSQLENEMPVCDMTINDDEKEIIRNLAPLSLKPTIVISETNTTDSGTILSDNGNIDTDKLIKEILDKSGYMFFYTAGKPEVHGWLVKKGSDIVTCAGKIHSDLARGFIKADIVNIKDIDKFHNLNDARTKGLALLVDRDYIIREGDIIEIRFNV